MVAQVWDCILGCCCRMSIPPNWHYVRAHPLLLPWPCPALPSPFLQACMHAWARNYKVHGRAGAFPSHRKYSTPVRDCTRPGGIARQEESCISFPSCVLLLLRLSLSMTTTYQPYNNTLSTCIPPAAVVSLLSPSPSPFSVSARPFFVHLTHNSSVAYLELQRSSLPPTTPTTPLVNNGAVTACARWPSRLFTFQCRPRKAQSGSCRQQEVDSTTTSPHGPDRTHSPTGPPGRPRRPSDSPRRGRLRGQHRRRTQATTWRTRGSK